MAPADTTSNYEEKYGCQTYLCLYQCDSGGDNNVFPFAPASPGSLVISADIPLNSIVLPSLTVTLGVAAIMIRIGWG